MNTLPNYDEWAGSQLADPRKASMDQIQHGLIDIVGTEGPVLKDRAFALYARAVGLGRVYSHTLTRMENGLKQARKQKALLVDIDQFGDFEEQTLRLPDSPPVLVRARGPRTLHEIPAPEIAEVMLDIRLEHELISKEDLFRDILKGYGLVRLTKATEERLSAILETWIL